jgi:adenylate kinase family enzyme
MALTNAGFPVEDLAGYIQGDPLPIKLRETTLEGKEFKLRDYQKEAAQVFYASGSEKGGSGVIVLPCCSGKTVIGLATMALVQTKTLILTPNISASRQWIREICDKTDLTIDQVKQYSGEVKEIGPVTVATYQILTQRKRVKKDENANATEELEMSDEEVKKELANFPLVLSSVGRWEGEEFPVMEAAKSANHEIKAVVLLNISEEDAQNRWDVAKTLGDRGDRSDDREKTVLENRIKEFREKTMPVIETYRKMGILLPVQATGTREEVFANVVEALAKLSQA